MLGLLARKFKRPVAVSGTHGKTTTTAMLTEILIQGGMDPSAIIGGTSFFGGKGRIFSVVIGGLIIGTINNGLNILQVQTYYQLVVMGGLIIAAVALDRLISK